MIGTERQCRSSACGVGKAFLWTLSLVALAATSCVSKLWSPLPEIQVEGAAAGTVSFSPWEWETFSGVKDGTITATMRYSGQAHVSRITFAAFDDKGIKLREGEMMLPRVRPGEAVKVKTGSGVFDAARVVVRVE